MPWQYSIPTGTRFVALYCDGSGASLYLIDDEGELYDATDGKLGVVSPDAYLQDTGKMYWIELPATFKFWFERA